VTDDQADGYCVYARVWWSDNTFWASNWACPKGTTRSFDFTNPNPYNYWTHTELNWIYVG
jgi:hypothetical protein